MACTLTVVQAGPLVTIQDRGRFGQMRYGVPASGPMDRVAFALANACLGNPAGAPCIEISLGGVTVECTDGAVTFALIGGGFDLRLDGAAQSWRGGSWTVGRIDAGTRMTIRPGPWGCWTYLAFAGQLRCDRWLGSASTHAASGLGGGALTTGLLLQIDGAEVRSFRHGPVPCPVFARPHSDIRVILGPQDRYFDPSTIAAFLGHPFMLTTAYDRMGVRLSGPSLRPDAVLDMPSEPIVRGAVQVAGDGVATVLLADHQTTGGYPKIATILSADLDGFVHLRPRSHVAFRAIDPATAIAATRTWHHAQGRFLDAQTRRQRDPDG